MIEIKNKITGAVLFSIDAESLQGAKLEGASLQYANLVDAKLMGADLRGAKLMDADLRGAKLMDANLVDASLHYANLRGADLRGADLQYAILRDANLVDADLVDANLDHACWPLWCGGAHATLDRRGSLQLLYHAVNQHHLDPEVRSALAPLVALADKFRTEFREDAPEICWKPEEQK